jgi:predicted enzyme related to lactoylglutathione lyase
MRLEARAGKIDRRDAAEAVGGTITNDIREVPGGSVIFMTTDPAGAPVGSVGTKGDNYDE